MQEAEEDFYWEYEDDTGPGGVRRIGLVMFMTAAAVIFVVALLISLGE
jgi:hypothetical protein